MSQDWRYLYREKNESINRRLREREEVSVYSRFTDVNCRLIIGLELEGVSTSRLPTREPCKLEYKPSLNLNSSLGLVVKGLGARFSPGGTGVDEFRLSNRITSPSRMHLLGYVSFGYRADK